MEGLRSEEKHLRLVLDENIPQENLYSRKFAQMGEADQVDEIIMKYIFMRPNAPDGFLQYSLIGEINKGMVYENMPRIRYDLVELYW